MLATSKIKWFGTIIFAGTFLVLAVMGGKWGTTYSASASVAAAPHIDSIVPFAVHAGSTDIIMIISGSNFGNTTDTRVRLTGIGIDQLIEPLQVLTGGISVRIPDSLLTTPTLYILTVVKSVPHSVPTIPITPWDEESNPVPFTVYQAQFFYHPIIFR